MKVFVGHDSRWDMATKVCVASIHAHTPSARVFRLDRALLPKREPHDARTEFSFLRFLIPWLCRYEGMAIYVEQDMLILDDLAKMVPSDGDWQVACVQHGYSSSVKRPNWSSVMVLNCPQLKHWTPELYQMAPRKHLHELECVTRFEKLDPRWNVLDVWQPDIGILHYTSGGIWDKQKVKGERPKDPRATALWLEWAAKCGVTL